MNITLDNTSPQFQFFSSNDTWIQDHREHLTTGLYFQKTFHSSVTRGDTVKLAFTGSSIYVFGSMGQDHGWFSVQIDDGNPAYKNGFSIDDQFQQLLYSQDGLDITREHTVTITNLGTRIEGTDSTAQMWFDLDYAIITTPHVGDVRTTIYDDTASAIEYGGNLWSGGPLQPSLYYLSTAHITPNIGDSFALNFSGFSVGIYGGLYSDHGNYTVNLDGQTVGNYNGTWFNLAPGTTLFTANNLTEGPHRIIVTNVGRGPSGSFFDFDYAVVNSTLPNATTSAAGSPTTGVTGLPDNQSADVGDNTPVGAIAGGTVGGILILAALGLFAWWSLRRRNRAQALKNKVDLTGDGFKRYEGSDPAVFVSSAANRNGAGPSDGSVTPYQSSQPYLSSLPPPPASSATSYPHSENPPSSVGIPEHAEEASQHGTPFNRGTLGKLQPFFATGTLPASSIITASDYNSSLASESQSHTSHSASRIQIKGRATDMGPATVHEEDEEAFTLPPDYTQATQPLTPRLPAGGMAKR